MVQSQIFVVLFVFISHVWYMWSVDIFKDFIGLLDLYIFYVILKFSIYFGWKPSLGTMFKSQASAAPAKLCCCTHDSSRYSCSLAGAAAALVFWHVALIIVLSWFYMYTYYLEEFIQPKMPVTFLVKLFQWWRKM